MNKKCVVFSLIMMCVLQCSIGYCNTQQKMTAVFLPFTDNTQYFRNGYDKLFEEMVVEKFFDIERFDILERNNSQECKRLYNQICIRRESVRDLLKEKNFLDIIKLPQKDFTRKNRDTFLSDEITSVIGNKNNAKFLIHGSIDYLGKDRTYNNVAGIRKRSNKLTVVATIRIVVSETGKVIWYKRLQESSSDSVIDFSGFKVGTNKLSDKLFYDLFTEISDKFADELVKDFNTNKIIF